MAKFIVREAIAFAWGYCWANNLLQRGKGNDFRGNTYYLTARDIEQRVRCCAQESLEGVPWGTKDWWPGMSSSVRMRLPGTELQHVVRQWLLANPKITGHNFGRGHVSGMRFRPVGEPLGPAEQKTIAAKAERKANPRPPRVHYSPAYGGRAVCQKPRRGFISRHSRAWTTTDWGKVTCPCCLNIHKQEQTPAN